VSEERRKDDHELRRLRSEVAAQQRDIHDRDDLGHRQDALIARLRDEAAVRDEDLAVLRERLETAQHELEDLRAVRDALTPPELPRRPGLELAAAFLPALAEQVSGDFDPSAARRRAPGRVPARPRDVAEQPLGPFERLGAP
jgi:serine phosphatase RsbU (regulator of sigma subunit)